MKQDMSEDILIKYILEEAAADEITEVETWIATDAANAKKFGELKMLLEASKRLAQESPLGEAEAWARFKDLRATGKQGPAKISTMTNRQGYYRWLQVAAAVILLIGGGWLTYYFYNGQQSSAAWVSLKATNTVRVDTLPDGSIIHLNKNTSIAYASNFSAHRVVRINGEAFFEVKHDEALPFTVQVKDILIKDIGTAFNVKSNKQRTEVIVESGVVGVSKDEAFVKLNALEKVVIRPGDKTLKMEGNNDQLYNYYRTRKFIASNTPLWRLVEALNEAYGVDIQIRNAALRNTPITVTIKLEDSLKSALNVLKETTPGMKVDESTSGIMIK
jgi:ferric-dicitrate binding protein FerR (iron transport regulator)